MTKKKHANKADVLPNRGRLQAQGGDTEKSVKWERQNIPTKTDGTTFLSNLQGKLGKRELTLRKKCFSDALIFIQRAPVEGYECLSRSFLPSPPYKDIRVDVEIKKGKAFSD